MPARHYVIKPGDFDDARVKALLTRHLQGMHANSPPGHVFALDWSTLQRPEISFYTLWEGEDLLGFGALKELEALSGEIKSMRTADEHLRKGVGTAILEHIIAEARRRRYSRLSLETGPGPVFEPALTLYRKYGFVDGGAFGEYKQSSFNQFLHLDLNVLRAGRRPPNEYQRMDRRLRQQVLAYDDERAREYEEAYTVGTGTASIPDPEVFKADARALEGGIEIRAERRDDAQAVRDINERAFGNSAEARLVAQLRAAGKVVLSLVADDGGRLVGHILFSPVMVASAPAGFRGAGLAPVSVVPESQNQGIGSRLVRAGLEACREARYDIVVVLGHVACYPRFGFAPARDHGLENEYGAADEFMVLELRKGALKGIDGLVTFAPEFRETGC